MADDHQTYAFKSLIVLERLRRVIFFHIFADVELENVMKRYRPRLKQLSFSVRLPICSRDLILNLKDETKTKIVEVISLLPCNLTAEDVTDFCALAQYYDSKTPSSFKQVIILALYTS